MSYDCNSSLDRIVYEPAVWGSDIPPLPFGIDDRKTGEPITLQSADVTLYDARTRKPVVTESTALLVDTNTGAEWTPSWSGSNSVPRPTKPTTYLGRWHLVDASGRDYYHPVLFEWTVLPLDPPAP